MDYQVSELIRVMRKMDAYAKAFRLPELNMQAVKQGLINSKNVCRQPEEVVATPWMKNLMVILGDISTYTTEDGVIHHDRLMTGQPSKAVVWMNKVVDAALRKFNGAEQHDYPESIPVSSRQLYDIDCWNGWKKEVWDIQPGQQDQLAEGFTNFRKPKTNMSAEEVIDRILKNKALQASILQLLRELPVTSASREVRAISDPFMSKGTGVSYPDYRNDRAPYDDTTTYAKHEIDLAVEASKRGIRGLEEFARENNVCTGYARWQRGKGRPLIAMSRRTNLVINCVDGPEMKNWKDSKCLRAAFVDEEQLLNHLAELGDWVLAHPDSDVANIDYSKWDQNLGAGWILFQNAIRYMKAADEYTRRLILIRNACNSRAYLVDGLANSVRPIYGRMFSGYDDTTLGNSTANRGISRWTCCENDRNHIRDYSIPLGGCDMTVVGDDLLVVAKKGFIDKFAKVSNKNTLTVVHEDEKHARGIMFIQYRAYKDQEGKWVMAYNWPRVLRSMCSKENAKNLGRAGWTLSAYQQLGKLIRVPDVQIPLNIIAALDQYHLSLDVPISELKSMLQQEDDERIRKGVTNRTKKMQRKNTTAERLYNSNPNIPGTKMDASGNVDVDWDYFEMLQAKLKAYYSPDWLPKTLGIPNPDLSKVS